MKRRQLLIAPLIVALATASCGGSGTSASSGHRTTRPPGAGTAPAARPQATGVGYRPLFSLPAPLQDPASGALGGDRFVLLGGLDAADSSSSDVLIAGPGGVLRTATLPGPQHDAQAATIAGGVYVFGGGDFVQYDHILRFDAALDSTRTAGALPRPASDVAVTETGGTAFIVGGFDGASALDTIVAWRPGTAARVVAQLPVALRYAAVAAVGGAVLIIGGSTPSGASDAIYRFDPAGGTVRQIGRLPQPVTHAGAAVLGSSVYLVGGRGDNADARTAAVWSIDPSTGAVHRAGRLPQPLSDAGVLSVGDAIIVAGGRSDSGTQAAVGELVPQS